MLKEEIIRKIKYKLSMQDSLITNFIKKKYIEKKKQLISYRCYERQYGEVSESLLEELSKVLTFSNDYEFLSYEEEFEKRIAKYCGCKHAIGMDSGTAAIQFYLAALNLSEGDEIIGVANTHVGTALAITNLDLKPVFVDIQKDDYTIDTKFIEEKITERTRLLLPVHIYGNSCDMLGLLKISKEYKIPILEDAAQAFGSMYCDRLLPFTGEGVFSFHTSKNFGGLGNGGIILTNNKKLKNKIKLMKDLDYYDDSLKISKRTPSSLNAVQIAFLKAKLPFIDNWTKRRRENARFYNEELKNRAIILPVEKTNIKNNYHSYVIRTKKRDKLKWFLEKNKIETKIEYPYPLHLTRIFKNLKNYNHKLPITESTNKEILSLPINPFLQEEELKKVITTIKNFFK